MRPTCRLPRSKTNHANSLIELVFASFLLLIGFTLVATIFQRSLAYQATVERNTQAADFANSVLADIREKASDYDFFKADDWSSFSSVTDPLSTGLVARVSVQTAALNAPCTNLEERWPLGERRVMTGTMNAATIEVLDESEKILTLVGYIQAPEARVRFSNPVIVSPLGPSVTSLGRDEETDFTAKLFDSDGDEIPDVEFSFEVNPVEGNASISPSRVAPQAATLKNVYLRSNGTRIYTGGTVKVRATARYFGNQYSGDSEEVTLLR